MDRKRHIVLFLMALLGTAGIVRAQHQTVVDDHGKAVDVLIPSTGGMMEGYVVADYSDAKSWHDGMLSPAQLDRPHFTSKA